MLTIQDAGIYCDSGTNPWNACEYHFSQLIPHNNELKLGTNYYQSRIEDFLNSEHNLKFAAFHVSFPVVDSWIERFDKVYPSVVHSFVFCSELHQVTIEQLDRIDRPNVSIYIAGKLNYKFKNAQIKIWMDWFVTSTDFYKNINPDLLDSKLDYFGKKPKLFDILLGCRRDHRTVVNNFIVINNLQNTNVMTYHQKWSQDLRLSHQYITEDEGVEYSDPPNHTVQYVKYFGYNMSMSQIVPIKIYNQTYYSLVAETNAVNKFNFYTEKIVKPILARRLFIVIAGQNYLKNLRSFGFKTFSNVIDESYDEEYDDESRWNMALSQLKYLCNQDPQSIMNSISEIVKHNQKLMLTHDWYNDFKQDFLQDIVRAVDH
jgi:hypothetical protein